MSDMTTRYFRYFANVPVGEDAAMNVPSVGEESLEWALRYTVAAEQDTDKAQRMAAASCLASYTYLLSCTKEEAWRRIKLLRAAIQAQPYSSGFQATTHKGE